MPFLAPLIGPVIGALGSAGTAATTGAAAKAGTGITGGLEAISGFGSALSPFARLFIPGKEGKAKQAATRLQQQIEQAAIDVQNQVRDGLIDPETGIRRLEQIEAMVSNMMNQTGKNSQFFQAGGALAGRTVSNVMGNIRREFNKQTSKPFEPGKGFTGGPETQKRRLGTNLRNLFIVAPSGLEDTNAAEIFKGFDVESAVPRAGELSANIFGNRGPSESLTNLSGDAFDDLDKRRLARSFEGGL